MSEVSDEEHGSPLVIDTERPQVLVEVAEPEAPPVPRMHPMTTRLQSGIRRPNPRYALLTRVEVPPIPKTITAALKHPGWNKSMSEEMEAQIRNGTMTLVPRQPDMHILGSRWIHTVKMKADGSVDKLKSRWVAKGYEQEEGVDFIETYSHVVRTSTIRIVLNVSVAKNWKVRQFDVKNAFLHGELLEDVFVEQAPGFVDATKPNHVCHLHKALYGLKQAPRAWFNKFTEFLLEFGFKCSPADPSLFTYHRNGQSLVLLLYVDDVLLTGSSSDLMNTLIAALSDHFSMKDMGEIHYFLGIQAQYHENGLFLSQTAYAEEILFESGMASANPMPTPLPSRLDAIYKDDTLFPEPTYFRSIAGKLQYLTLTRPDIQFSVNLVCQRMHSPTMADFAMLKRILQYIRGTSSYGLHLFNNNSLSLNAFSDSDWAGCHDTHRSTTGFCARLGNNVVSWCAKRQPTVSRSSTEAEYRALAQTACELTWVNYVLRDLRIPQPAPASLRCDNLSAVHLSANPGFHSKTKHMELDLHTRTSSAWVG